ncbi:MAG: lysostaphin resistance A-like protein [Acidimicrobiia bacterium]
MSRAVMGVVLVVLAPITEEVMFRGVLLRALTKAGRRAAMVWSALIFAGFHLFGLSGDVLRGAILTMPTFFVMGLILASVTMKRGRLGPAIFIHSGFNLLAMVVLLMPPELVEQLLQP